MSNVAAARQLLAGLRASGVTEFCVCAGSRNAPLLVALGDAKAFTFVDERSAAFFAIGRIKLHGAPVAVVTTSGTAAAELLPATVEAYYSGLPLVLVTADRPARFRGTGAPQSIEQVGLFGVYAATSLESWTRVTPLHLNIEFDEPLLEVEERESSLSVAAGDPPPARTGRIASPPLRVSRPVVLLGGLHPRHQERVRRFLHKLGAPVYAEPLSGVREDPTLPLVTAGERMLRGFDSVIRIGNVPTLRFWRDLETLPLPIVHYSDLPFPGLTRGEVRPIEALPDPTPVERDEAFFARDRALAARFQQLLDDEPESELAMFRQLSRELPHGARVYLGNSLPIREWDLAATREPRGFVIEANRGANGIDGQLSTFLGWCQPGAHNVAVAGDLTALYDLNAPWIVPQLDASFRIVVINNRGGRIFERVPADPRLTLNTHGLHFEKWAEMFGIDVTELTPDLEASRRVWTRYEQLFG